MNRDAFILSALLLLTNAMASPTIVFDSVEPAPTPFEPPAVFGGTDRKLGMTIAGIDLKNASLRVELFQVAGHLAMPLGKTVVLPNVTIPGPVLVPVQFPPVKSETDILLRLCATNSANPDSISLGELHFAVFPHDLSAQIAAMLPPLPNSDKRLVVFGAGKKLRPALQAMHVPFEDGGENLPGRFESTQFYLGDVATHDEQQQAQDRSQGTRLAVFSSDAFLPPGLYVNRGADGIFILVTLPVLDHLATDPRAQLLLLKVIQSLAST